MKRTIMTTHKPESSTANLPLEQRKRIRRMFDAVARRYDLINSIFSFRRDVAWRRTMLQVVFQDKNKTILDIATGTGEVLLGMLQHSDTIQIFGADLSASMLKGAQKKLERKGLDKNILLQGDAATLSFVDHCIDTVTIAFGIRNFVQLPQSLKEIYRVLRPGGKVVILEFSLPQNLFIRLVYLFYFRYLMTPMAGKLSRQEAAYKYLDRSVEAFPEPNVICAQLYQAGFDFVEARPLTFGVATLYTARRTK
jgi:demethylmenaquinone methyltransferase/2-methoxy-6-polyprenyl-1,4-benzoquinol methylase